MGVSPWNQLLLARVLSWLHHPLADTPLPRDLGLQTPAAIPPLQTALAHRLVKVRSPAPSPAGPREAG